MLFGHERCPKDQAGSSTGHVGSQDVGGIDVYLSMTYIKSDYPPINTLMKGVIGPFRKGLWL